MNDQLVDVEIVHVVGPGAALFNGELAAAAQAECGDLEGARTDDLVNARE